jgi:hypothetical protein
MHWLLLKIARDVCALASPEIAPSELRPLPGLAVGPRDLGGCPGEDPSVPRLRLWKFAATLCYCG